ESDRSIVVVGNYKDGPISAVPCRAKTHPLRPCRSCFAPAETLELPRAWVEAPGTAPGSNGFITMAIYRHSRCRRSKYRRARARMQTSAKAMRIGGLRGKVLIQGGGTEGGHGGTGFARQRDGFAPSRAAISRPAARRAGDRRRPAGSHKYRYALAFWRPGPVRSEPGLPAADDQEAAREVDHLRAAVVFAGRYKCALAPAKRGKNLGCMGRRERRPRTRLWQPVAKLARRPRRDDRPDRQCGQFDQKQSEFAPAHRNRLEPGRGRRHGVAALPLPIPVLRRRGKAELPALSAERRYLPRRAIQYRIVCAADAYDGPGDRPCRRRFRAFVRRRAPLFKSRSASA